VRDETKFEQLIAFGRMLPALRRRVERDLGRTGLPREKVLAAVVRLLDATGVRVGNEEYARANGSFGLTTLRDRHVEVDGGSMRFEFRGKSGKHHRVELEDRRLAKIIKSCQDIPGYELFQYVSEDGQPQCIDSSDVNAYLAEIAGSGVTAKVFRTWNATVRALAALRRREPATLAHRGTAHRGRGDSRGRESSRQHARRVPQVVRASRGDRRLRRGLARQVRRDDHLPRNEVSQGARLGRAHPVGLSRD
jgi:DNA topoisomerase IB